MGKLNVFTALLLTLLSDPVMASIEDGLVASWDFSDGSGDTLRNSTGNEHHGRIVNATWEKTGKRYALRFGHRVRMWTLGTTRH